MAARIPALLPISILAATTAVLSSCAANIAEPRDPSQPAAVASAGGPSPASAPVHGGLTVATIPAAIVLAPGANALFSAAVAAVAPGAVRWSIREGTAGGTVDARGRYRAPATAGVFHVVATSMANPSSSAAATVTVTAVPGLDDGERRTVWSPGILGGIPQRRVVCSSVNAAELGDGQRDASAAIQAAIDACDPGQVVQLTPGTFRVDDHFLLVSKGITLRGAGATRTFLKRTNGAVKGTYVARVADPVIVVGPNRWPKADESSTRALAADGEKGALSVKIAGAHAFAPGQLVLLDEDDYETGAWKALPNRGGAPAAVQIRRATASSGRSTTRPRRASTIRSPRRCRGSAAPGGPSSRRRRSRSSTATR